MGREKVSVKFSTECEFVKEDLNILIALKDLLCDI